MASLVVLYNGGANGATAGAAPAGAVEGVAV